MYIAEVCDKILEIVVITEQRLDKGEITTLEAYGYLQDYMTAAAIDIRRNALDLNKHIGKLADMFKES